MSEQPEEMEFVEMSEEEVDLCLTLFNQVRPDAEAIVSFNLTNAVNTGATPEGFDFHNEEHKRFVEFGTKVGAQSIIAAIVSMGIVVPIQVVESVRVPSSDEAQGE